MFVETPQEYRPPKYARGCGLVFFGLMLTAFSVWGALLGGFVYTLEDAQGTIEALDRFRPKIGSKVYSADGELLGEFTTEEVRQLVPLNEIPLHLQKAFIATEDDRFYSHKGVRPDAIMNAAVYIAQTGNIRGGSTITQQLVRNVGATGISKEQTVQRKLKEAVVALQLEREYTKDEILELYLNQIFLGVSASGVEAASRQYFGKSCREITISEAAMLAGLARSPNKNEPFEHIGNAIERRDIVLGQMLENGFITQGEYERAMTESIEDSVVTPEERDTLEQEGHEPGYMAPNQFKAPYFVQEVRKYLLHEVGYSVADVFSEGLEIHTTVNMEMQRAAEETLLTALEDFDAKRLETLERQGRADDFAPATGALVCIDNREGYKGYIRAMVGGRDFETEKFNAATQAQRQAGSSVKPFVWAAAIDNGYTAAGIVVDEPYVRVNKWGGRWAPQNFSHEFLGPVTLRTALLKSINIVSIKLVEDLGVPLVSSYFKDAELFEYIDPHANLTIALGTPATTVLRQCAAYSIFPNQGLRYEPVLTTEIRDRDGFVRMSHKPEQPKKVLDASVAYVVNYLLEGNAESGTGWRTRDLERPRGGKTGTTNDSRDAWFCGYTPDLTTVVWLGYRDNRPLGSGRTYTGGALASPIWTDFMKAAHQDIPVHDFEVPDGVVFKKIDKNSGLAGGNFREAFVEGTGPRERMPEYLFNEDIDDILKPVSQSQQEE